MPTWKELVDTSTAQTLTNKTLTDALANTQSASDNSTKVATTAYADAQAALGDTTLSDGTIWLGNGSDAKVEITLSGDVTIDNAGVTTIGSQKVSLSKIKNQAANTVLVRDADDAGVLSAKALATTEILIGDGTGFTAAALSGDVTMTNAGVVSIADDTVSSAELADACSAVTSFTAPLIEGSTSVQTPLIEYTDGDDAITIADGGGVTFPIATTHTGGVQTATIDYTDGDLAMTIADGGAVTTSGALTVTGDLTVNGTTTTVNTATLEVEDHIILLATNASPTPDTGTAAGIQVETSATEGHMPEITWTKDVGASNDGTYDGSGTLSGLTGWRVSNHQVTNQRDFAIQVCDYKTDTGAPSSENSAGMGAMLLNTYDEKVYVRTA